MGSPGTIKGLVISLTIYLQLSSGRTDTKADKGEVIGTILGCIGRLSVLSVL